MSIRLQRISARPISFPTAVGLSLSLVGCKTGILDPAGPVGAGERIILFDSLAIMLAIVLPTMAATVAFAWWFRSSNDKANYRPDWSYSGRLELLVWSIPALVVLFLGGIAWLSSHDLDPYKSIPSQSKALEVEVVSLDWKWLFIYPDQGIASVNQLVIPVGKPVHFRLTSTSVMNSFFIPQLGSQIYTMGGMATQLNLQADREGKYSGISAQFSGDGFSDMRFTVQATTSEAFTNWVQSVQRDGATFDSETFAAFARPSSAVPPATYHAIGPGFFDHIVATTARNMIGRASNQGEH